MKRTTHCTNRERTQKGPYAPEKGPSRVVLTEMVEPPEAMANAAALLAQQDSNEITGTIQRSEELISR